MDRDDIETAFVVGISVVVIFGGMGYVTYLNASAREQRNSFCQDNGYDMVISTKQEKKVDGDTFVQCLDEEIIDKELVEIKDWLLYKEAP